METRQQKLIRELLEQDSGNPNAASPDPRKTTSLHDQALRRADEGYVPRTLTPHEWEDYYRRVGVPREHRQAQPDNARPGMAVRLIAAVRRFIRPGATETVTRTQSPPASRD